MTSSYIFPNLSWTFQIAPFTWTDNPQLKIKMLALLFFSSVFARTILKIVPDYDDPDVVDEFDPRDYGLTAKDMRKLIPIDDDLVDLPGMCEACTLVVEKLAESIVGLAKNKVEPFIRKNLCSKCGVFGPVCQEMIPSLISAVEIILKKAGAPAVCTKIKAC
jgi:hypothetical protein